MPAGRTADRSPTSPPMPGWAWWSSANGAWTAVGGTSLAAPLVAGLVADRNDGCAQPTADFAPTLYGAAAQGLYGTGLTDITSGNNDLNNTYGGAVLPRHDGL